MIKQNQRILNLINILSDMALIFISYFIAIAIRFDVLDGYRSINLLGPFFIFVAVIYSIVIPVIYGIMGLYASFRLKRVGTEVLAVCAVNAFGILVWLTILYLKNEMDFSRIALFIFWLLSSGLVLGKRIVAKTILSRMRRNSRNLKHVAIVGAGTLAEQFEANANGQKELGLAIDVKLAASDYGRLPQIIDDYGIDILVIAIDSSESDYLGRIISAADKEGVRVELIPFYNEYIPANPLIEVLGDSKLIDLRATKLDLIGYAFLKRFFDILGSILLIIITSPIMLICAIGVKLSSPGPVLFRQERIGKDKKPFDMLKFRSMRQNSDSDKAWSSDCDPRKTAFGSFIRKYSLDELPQFFNVLKGEMSLVGPRPEIPYHVDHFKNEVPRYLVRQQVRPGITGWAQIKGFRGDTSIPKRIECDIWYIENWTPMLDIRILFETVFGGKFKNSEALTPAGNGEEKP